jgi:DNA-binding NarL/FixJ family response regulator
VLHAPKIVDIGAWPAVHRILWLMASRDPTPAEPVLSPARKGLRVVVADDDALLREGIASLLRDAGHEVVGSASDAPEVLAQVRAVVPDVAIVDVRMPPGNADDGLVAAAEIRRTHPQVAVLVLSQHLEPTYLLELVGEDASGVGYLLKDRVRDVAEFLDALERVAHGSTAFDPDVVRLLAGGRRATVLDALSARERDVLLLVAEGRSNRAIAAQLDLSPRAVERDVQSIFRKLGLRESESDNRRVLAVLALLGH